MARRERLPRDGATAHQYRRDRIIGFDVLERIGAEQQKVCFLPGSIVPISASSRMTRALSIVIARKSFASETPMAIQLPSPGDR